MSGSGQRVARRTVARVEAGNRLGPNAQVDDHRLLIAPTRPALTDPFLLLSEDWFSEPGFEWHPHRGLETVTMVLDGVLEHGDNIGNAGALGAGDVQWMTAGRGVIHRELAFRNERAHTLQLWVNLPANKKMVNTRYQDLVADRRPVVERDGSRIDVISGQVAGVSGPARTHWPISGAVLTIEPNSRLDHTLPGHDRAFLTVLSGRVTIAGRKIGEGQTAWSDPVPRANLSTIALETPEGDSPTVVMVFGGRPIRQQVVMGGPFVMNSNAEIHRAFADFHAGKFGTVPRQARLKYR
ncbi:pirin family protein [Plantactinospora sp. B5E13]|uniref:pirin family protein n=1 Tax=unclassified Plantactinospora TaxID=2631981 RepID=UPI00325D8C1A